MARFACGVCQYVGEQDIGSWACPECEMGAGWFLTEVDGGEERALDGHLQQISEHVLARAPQLRNGVYAYRGAVDGPVLDLLTLFFSHIALPLSSLELEGPCAAETRDKLEAYVEARLITVVDPRPSGLSGGAELPAAVSPLRLDDRPAHASPGVGSALALPERSVFFYAHAAGELLATRAMRRPTRALTDIAQKYVRELPRSLDGMAPWFGLTIAHREMLIASMLGCSLVADPVLKPLLASVAEDDVAALQAAHQGMVAAEAWYHRMVERLPRFRRPDTVIELRGEGGGDAFVNLVIRAAVRSGDKPFDQVQRDVARVLDRKIATARRFTGTTTPLAISALGGMIPVIGGAVGEPIVSAASGILGTAVGIGGQLAERRLRAWTVFGGDHP